MRDKWKRLSVALCVLIFVGLALSRTSYPYDVGTYEANAWAPASMLAHFHDPYSRGVAVHAPYIAAPYGPVYYAVVGLGLRLFGDQFWFGRLVGLAAGLISAWLVFRIAYRFTRDRFTAMLGSAMLLAEYPMLSWAGVQRPDLLALAFVLAGLNFGIRPREHAEHAWFPVWSALALVAAVLSRQTYVIPFAVVASWYLLERDYHALRRFGATAALVGGGIVGALAVTSHGGFVTNLITNQARAAGSLSELSDHLRALAESPVTWLTMILALLSVVGTVRGRRKSRGDAGDVARRRMIGLLLAYLALATFLALVSASRAGANINYFIEAFAVASLLVAVTGSEALGLTSPIRGIAALTLLCAGAVAIGAREAHGQILQWQARSYFAEIVADVRRIPPGAGPMYSDYPELIDLADRTSYVNDFVQYDGRSPALKTAFAQLLASGRLAAIVSANPVAPRGYVKVRLNGPRPAGVYFAYLYVRRGIVL